MRSAFVADDSEFASELLTYDTYLDYKTMFRLQLYQTIASDVFSSPASTSPTPRSASRGLPMMLHETFWQSQVEVQPPQLLDTIMSISSLQHLHCDARLEHSTADQSSSILLKHRDSPVSQQPIRTTALIWIPTPRAGRFQAWHDGQLKSLAG